MNDDWRYGVAGLGAGVMTAVIFALAALAIGKEGFDSLARLCREWGDVGIFIGAVLATAVVSIGPGALWYGLARLILRLLKAE